MARLKYTPRRTYTPKTPAGRRRPKKRSTIKEKRAAGATALQPTLEKKVEVVKDKILPTRPSKPSELAPLSAKDFRTTDERLTAESQRLATEKEKAATGAARVAEARARPPDTAVTGPTPYAGPEYVPSPYRPGTRPEDVEYGGPEARRRMEPQVTDIHEVIGGIIDVSASKFKAGAAIAEGKEVDVDVAKVEEPEKYVTRNIHDFITEKTSAYREELESERAQQAIRSSIYSTQFVPPAPEPYKKWAPERLITGLLRIPATGLEALAMVPLGAEHMIRTKGEVVKDFPLAAGVVVEGMKQEAVTDPLAFLGEIIAFPLITKAAHLPPIPSTIKTKIPSIPSTIKPKIPYDPMGFPAEFGKGKPVRKYIKKIPGEFKTFLKAEEAVVELKKLRKKQKADPTAKLKEKWAKREEELETLAKEGGYTVTKEGQILISKVKQEPKVVSLIKDPLLEQFKMKPEEIISTKMKVYPKVEGGKKIDVYIAKPKEVVKVFEPFKKEVSIQTQIERSHVVQSLKELQRLKALQEPISVVKAKPSVKAKARTKSLQEQRSALVVLLKTAQTQSQRDELRSTIASIDTQISSVSSTALVIQAPVITVDGIPPMPKPSQYIPPPIPTVDEVPPKPYQYVPPPIPPLEEIPPLPKPKTMPKRKPKEPKKPVGFIRKETPGYAWQLANPIATLEQLLGVEKTTKIKASRKKSKSKKRK